MPVLQKDEPEEDMDTRGGGQAAQDQRIVKDEDYPSDNEAEFMDDKDSVLPGLQQQQRKQHTQQAQHAQHAQQQSGYPTDGSGRGAGVSSHTSAQLQRLLDMMRLHARTSF